MTGKRFTHKKWYNERQLFDGDEPFAIVDVYIQAEAICDKLNELHEENEQSKMMIATLRNIILENEDLEEKNKKLKKIINENEKMIQSIYEELTKLRLIKNNLRKIKNQWNWIMESVDYD